MFKIALCDDNPGDIEKLHNLLNEYIAERELQTDVSVYNHPDKLLNDAETKHFHLYLLDIVMPMVNGIQTAREIRWNDKNAQIVFVTSEKTYALEAFDVNPVNYILKPINKEKFYSTLDLAFSRIETEKADCFTVKTKEGVKKFSSQDVLFVEYSNHLVRFNLIAGDVIQTVTQRISFDEYIKTNIQNADFVRCHESFLVNLKYLDVLTKNTAELRGGRIIPVSKSRYAEFQKAYLNYRLD